MAKEILINQLFAGNYLAEGTNIGHEIINLFKDDDGNNNIFITPSGVIDENHNIEYILFVRHIAKKETVEVIGLAEVSSKQKVNEEDIRKITYDGASLEKIFGANKYHDEIEQFANYVTYRADNILLPKKRIFITINNESYDEAEKTIRIETEKKAITPQSMRVFFSDVTDEKAYKILKKDLINDVDCWYNTNTTKKVISYGAPNDYYLSFLEVIRKENDENVISNLLAYYFDFNHEVFQKFANTILGIKDLDYKFTIYRETKHRVDLWIETKDHIIVIENKIKSGINGINKDENTNQLEKYYKKADAEKKQRTVKYYIFEPDYASFNPDQLKKDGKYEYTEIKYSKIYKFFLENAEAYITDRVFPDFLRGLKRHTLSLSDLQYETMKSRLLRRIKS